MLSRQTGTQTDITVDITDDTLGVDITAGEDNTAKLDIRVAADVTAKGIMLEAHTAAGETTVKAAGTRVSGGMDRGIIAWSPGAGVTDGSPIRDDTADSGIMGATGGKRCQEPIIDNRGWNE